MPCSRCHRIPTSVTTALLLLLLLVVPALFTVRAGAQDYIQSTGFPPFTVSLPVEHGVIDISNGNVHIEFTFAAPPQRGTHSVTEKLVYDSRIWTPLSTGTSSEWGMPHDTWYLGWRTERGDSHGLFPSDSTWVPCGASGYWLDRNFVYADPQGTLYHFPLTVAIDGSPASGCSLPAQQLSAYATDSSGYYLVAVPDPEFATEALTLYMPDGTVYDGSDTYKDSNGNISSFAATGIGDPIDTLGRTPVVGTPDQGPGTDATFQALTSAGTLSTYAVRHDEVNLSTAFGQSGVTEYSGPADAYTKLTLPDGNSYQLSYDSYGELSGMTLPTGGQVSFGYSNFVDAYGNVNRWVTSYSAGGGTWTITPQVLSTCAAGAQNCQQKVTVHKPSGDSVVYTFTMNGGAWPVQAQYFDQSGSLLLTTTRDYDLSNTCSTCSNAAAYVRPVRETDTVPSAGGVLTRKREYNYDNIDYGNIAALKEWKFYSGAPSQVPDRETDTTYLTATAYLNRNLIKLPASMVVKSAAGTTVAQSLYTYDSTPLVGIAGVVQHDDTNYGTANTVRGNITSVQRWVTGASYLTTTFTYDTTGQLRHTTDPAGNVTTYGYADAFYNDNGVSPPAPTSSPSGPTNAYVTQITSPLIGSQTFGYYYGSGKAAWSTDQNGAPSYSHYVDFLDRPTVSVGPDGGWSLTSYSGATVADTYTGLSTSVASSGCSGCIHKRVVTDGLGRVSQTALLSDPDGAVYSNTSYDTSGRVSSTTNPYRSSSDTTYGSTAYQYDGLGRAVSTTKADGNVYLTQYGAALSGVTQLCSSGTYGTGYPSRSVDPTGKQRQYWTDGFGRLIEVDEPNGSNQLAVATCYRYDVLGNLSQAQQQAQTRTYAYDALSRVTSATIPETGTTTFYYTTSTGGLCAGDPAKVCRKTDARGITTTYAYDALSRLTDQAFSDTTPAIAYRYDGSSVWGVTLSNTKGRVSHAVSKGVSERIFSYDASGRIVLQTECLPSNCGSSSYTTLASYDLAGNMTSLTYPSGRKVSYQYTNAGRTSNVTLVSAGGQALNFNYLTGMQYAPNGALARVALDNSVTNALTATFSYNRRWQPQVATVSSPLVTVMKHTYGFADANGHNNGNLLSNTDNLCAARTESFTYDPLNRLATASQSAWGLSYVYDLYGNLLQQNVTAGAAPQINVTVGTNNQITGAGYTYDLAGNLIGDGAHTYVYNGLGELSSLDSSSVMYGYDPSAVRVRKTIGSNWMEYIRFGGSVIAEHSQSGTWSDYIMLGGKRVARADDFDRAVHITGTNCSNCGSQYSLFTLSNAGGLNGYVIRSGDRLFVTQYQASGSHGGVVLNFTDGSNSNWTARDQDGYYANDDGTQTTNHYRTIDLSSFAGKTISAFRLNSETDTAAGTWNILYQQLVFFSTDGGVRPIYTGQTSVSVATVSGTSGVTGRAVTVDTNTNEAAYPSKTTYYFHSDHIGSSRMITTAYGYPIWQGTFLPFGTEYNPQPQVDHYKFTGYEHDDESGLENANLRQLSSQLARFTSPDPGAGTLSNPQTLNKYAYVGNNPLAFSDPTGAYRCILCGGLGGPIGGGGGDIYGGGYSPVGDIWGGGGACPMCGTDTNTPTLVDQGITTLMNPPNSDGTPGGFTGDSYIAGVNSAFASATPVPAPAPPVDKIANTFDQLVDPLGLDPTATYTVNYDVRGTAPNIQVMNPQTGLPYQYGDLDSAFTADGATDPQFMGNLFHGKGNPSVYIGGFYDPLHAVDVQNPARNQSQGLEAHNDTFNPTLTGGYGLGLLLHGVVDVVPYLFNKNGIHGTVQCSFSTGCH